MLNKIDSISVVLAASLLTGLIFSKQLVLARKSVLYKQDPSVNKGNVLIRRFAGKKRKILPLNQI